jgi:hypothetical protein
MAIADYHVTIPEKCAHCIWDDTVLSPIAAADDIAGTGARNTDKRIRRRKETAPVGLDRNFARAF